MWHINSTEDVSICISEVIQILIPQTPVCVQNIVHDLQQPVQNLLIGATSPGMTWLLKSDIFPWFIVIPLTGCWLSLGKQYSCYLLVRKYFLSFLLCMWWFGPCPMLIVLLKEKKGPNTFSCAGQGIAWTERKRLAQSLSLVGRENFYLWRNWSWQVGGWQVAKEIKAWLQSLPCQLQIPCGQMATDTRSETAAPAGHSASSESVQGHSPC